MDSREDSRTRGVADLVRLGELLERHANPRSRLGLVRPLRADEALALKAEIESLERSLTELACTRANRALRAMLDIRRDDFLDPLVLRIMAYVAYNCLALSRGGPPVSMVAQACSMGDTADMLEARHLIRHFIIKGLSIAYVDAGLPDGEIRPGRLMTRYLSGDNRLNVIWNEESLRQERGVWARQHGASRRTGVGP